MPAFQSTDPQRAQDQQNQGHADRPFDQIQFQGAASGQASMPQTYGFVNHLLRLEASDKVVERVTVHLLPLDPSPAVSAAPL